MGENSDGVRLDVSRVFSKAVGEHGLPEDAFEKMATVEQHDRLWLEQQKDGRFGDYSFQAFLDEWTRNYKSFEGGLNPMRRDGISVNGAGAIYGAGGFNRYTVRCSGEIMFITAQGRSRECRERAVAQGFALFPEDM